MFYRSERLFLRPEWPEDGPDIAALLGDRTKVVSNLAPDTPGRGTDGLPLPLALPCRMSGSDWRLLHKLLITMPSANGAELIGGIGLTPDGADVALGYWLFHAHWGHGFAAEAARAVLSIARSLGHERVIANQSVDDQASLLVLTRAGFRPTGEQRLCGDGAMAAIYVAELGSSSAGPSRGGREVRAA